MKYLLAITLSLAACGRHSSGDDSAPVTSKVTAKQDFNTALMIADLASLPACDTKGALVYVMETKAFMVCDGDWVQIDIAVQNTMADSSGQEWLLIPNVQRAKVKSVCPAGFDASTKQEIKNLADLDKDLLIGLADAHANIWLITADNGTVLLSSSNSSKDLSQTWTDGAEIHGVMGSVLCKKN